MKRKLVATGIAVIVSIPLIPVLEKGIGHLTGTDAPMVFPAHGWQLEKEADKRRIDVANGSRREAIIVTDASGSMKSFTVGNTIALSRGLVDLLPANVVLHIATHAVVPENVDREIRSWGRLRNAYQGGDLTVPLFTDADAAGNRFAARGEFGGFYTGYVDEIWKKAEISGAHWGIWSYTYATGEGEFLRSLEHYGLPLSEAYFQLLRPRADSDGDGLPDGSMAYLYGFQTEQSWTGIDYQEPKTWNDVGTAATPIHIQVETPTTPARRTEIKGSCEAAKGCGGLYVLVRPHDAGSGITAGPDGALWFTGHGENVGAVSSSTGPSEKAATISAISPASVTAGVPALTLTVNGTSFASGATVTFSASASGGTAQYQWYLVNSPELAAILAQTSRNVNDTGAGTLVTQRPQRLKSAGWYSLDVGGTRSDRQGLVELDFVPDSGGAPVRYTLTDSGTGGQEAGLIHLNEPGSVTIRGMNAEPKLRGMAFADFISRAFDITLQKALLTVFLLAELLPLSAWILVVWRIRSYAYKKISLLPRLERKPARHEVDLMLNFAKWSGVSCYVLWTAKDILAGAGIVFCRWLRLADLPSHC